MIQPKRSPSIQVRFAEHISSSHRQLILAELDEMGAVQNGVRGDYVLLRLGRSAKDQYVIRLLKEEEEAGHLVWETKED